jgi:zinc transport system substrate-binding protein
VRRQLLAALSPAILVPVVLGLAGAGAGSRPGDRVDVVASFYPLQYAAQQVGGGRVAVTNLVRPGAEPHELELTPQQVGRIQGADLVVYLRHFQPAVDRAVDDGVRDRAFDAGSVVRLRGGYSAVENGARSANRGTDPHVWLDPVRYAAIADAVGRRLAARDPAHAAAYTGRAADLHRRLAALDAEYRAGLAHCGRHDIVTSHNAFGYLAERYGLTQISVTGLNPDAEPSPGRVARVAQYARDHHVTTIFFEALVSPKVDRTLAEEVGARTAVLDPIEGVPAGSHRDYFTLMRANLRALRTALDCA